MDRYDIPCKHTADWCKVFHHPVGTWICDIISYPSHCLHPEGHRRQWPRGDKPTYFVIPRSEPTKGSL